MAVSGSVNSAGAETKEWTISLIEEYPRRGKR
jgi:hypothetical protein